MSRGVDGRQQFDESSPESAARAWLSGDHHHRLTERRRAGLVAATSVRHVQQGADVERNQPGLPAGLWWPRHAGVGQELPD